ncbi:hypothetical protein NQ317_001713 [Molorchus minor]|uniref:Uncharacterized protein n=1 Tax=Molorchus minor TaxID=1323400 RepID=A0ABQ9J545_9CUCU|nr:hypothetical protein NQ317_001713 [Molorchus minor]
MNVRKKEEEQVSFRRFDDFPTENESILLLNLLLGIVKPNLPANNHGLSHNHPGRKRKGPTHELQFRPFWLEEGDRPRAVGELGATSTEYEKGRPRTDATGRTFFDLQFINVGYNYNYNVNCDGGSATSTGGGNLQKPPHKPILGGLFQSTNQDTGGQQGGNKPLLSLLFGNGDLQGGSSQSQTQTQTGIISGTISGLASLLPKPQDVGQGLGEGISSFPHYLRYNQCSPKIPPLTPDYQQVARAPYTQPGASVPSQGVTPAGPDQATEPDPDTIYNDDSVKPVHEPHDPVTDPHLTNKLPPGQYLVASHPLLGVYYNRNRQQIQYQTNKNYYDQRLSSYVNQNKFHFQHNKNPYRQNEDIEHRALGGTHEGRNRQEDNDRMRDKGRSFRFPS